MKILLLDGKTQSLVKLTDLFIKQKFQTAYLSDPLQAINALKKHKFDVIICAQDIKKTSVVNLFKALTIKFPSVVRLLVAVANGEQIPNSVNAVSHYVFDQNSDLVDIINTVKSFADSKNIITKDIIVKAVANVKTLPSPPKVYLQLNAILKNDNTDSEKIAEIISQDPALVAKVLQFSNTSFMPNGKKLTNITEAITKMGVETLSCIVMTAELFSYQPDIPNFSLQDEQLHSLATARFTANIVDESLKHDALLAGLLHDIGKLVLFEIDKALTLKYFENCARTSSDILLEKKIFATDHCQIGAYLMHVWSFPYHIIDAVLHHHDPKKLLSTHFGVTQALYLANCLLTDTEVDKTFVEHFKLADSTEKLTQKALRFK